MAEMYKSKRNIDISIDDESNPPSEQQRIQDLNNSVLGQKQLNSSFHGKPSDLRKKKPTKFWKQESIPDSHRGLMNSDEGEVD
jgi:hypothetical protein